MSIDIVAWGRGDVESSAFLFLVYVCETWLSKSEIFSEDHSACLRSACGVAVLCDVSNKVHSCWLAPTACGWWNFDTFIQSTTSNLWQSRGRLWQIDAWARRESHLSVLCGGWYHWQDQRNNLQLRTARQTLQQTFTCRLHLDHEVTLLASMDHLHWLRCGAAERMLPCVRMCWLALLGIGMLGCEWFLKIQFHV